MSEGDKADIRYHYSNLFEGKRAYEASYGFVAFKVDDEHCRRKFDGPTTRIEVGRGPIFPSFIKADFSTYERFRVFTEHFGLEGLSYLDEEADYPLAGELNKRIKGESESISKSYSEQLYRRVRNRLLIDQGNVQLYYQCFVTGEHPSMKRSDYSEPWPSSEPFPSGELPAWPFEVTEGRDIFKGPFALGRILKKQLSYIRLIPAIDTDPTLGKWQEIWEVARGIRKTDRLLKGEKKIPSPFALKKKAEISGRLIGKTDWEKASRKFIGWKLKFTTIPSRCYMEMIDLVQDEKKLKECGHCSELFIPSRKNEEYCSRLTPEYRDSTTSKMQTCKKIGPQKKHAEKNKDYRQKYKEFKNRLSYLKKMGNHKKYQKVEKEFLIWKRQYQTENR